MNVSTARRPVVELPTTRFEAICTGLAFAALVAQVGAIAWLWSRLPGRIPMHFGPGGRPDAWGGRGTILLVPVVTAALFALLGFVARFPHAFNYPFPIAEANAPQQYALARGLLMALRAALGWLFFGITAGTARAAIVVGGLSWTVPGAGLLAVFGTLLVYFVLAARAR